MLVNNNISPLPFYESLSLQNHRKDYAFGQIYPLIFPLGRILPFQVIIPEGLSEITSAILVSYPDNIETNITALLLATGLEVKIFAGFSLIRYFSSAKLAGSFKEGRYYLRINLPDGSARYSDIFTFSSSAPSCLHLSYTNDYSLKLKKGMIDFSDGFTFECYLSTQIGKPEYIFEEEATERAGYTFIESQVSKKLYKFTFLAPEFLCDALRIVRLCNTKVIDYGTQSYDITTFSIDAKWEDQGDLASVDAEFETDTVIANIGGLSGDFSAEFNNDYSIVE